MKRRAFTLIELMISIMILSVLMLFLYKSYTDLNKANKTYAKAVEELHDASLVKQTLYLDILLSSKKSVLVTHESSKYDFVSFSTEHSLHRLIKPYVAYVVKDTNLYRVESNKEINTSIISREQPIIVDRIGDIKKFKIYPSKNADGVVLIEAAFKNMAPTIFKVKALN